MNLFMFIIKKNHSKNFQVNNPFCNNYIWLAERIGCKKIAIPNLTNGFEFRSNKYYLFNFNNFQFINIKKLILFYLFFF